MDLLYSTLMGHIILKVLLHAKMLALLSRLARSRISAIFIEPYIRKNNIDMADFKGQRYKNFADFFARKKEVNTVFTDPDTIISPCDGLLSMYTISSDRKIVIKISCYRKIT